MLTRHGASATDSSTHEKAASTVSLRGPLRELLAIDQRQTLEFFVLRLQDISDPTVDRQELLYNASVLAHYAQISTLPDVDCTGSEESRRGLRPFRGRHDPAGRPPHDGNSGRTVPAPGGILRGPDASTSQHPLICRVGREFLTPGRPARAVARQSPAARRHRETLRAVASAPRPTESRTAGPALSTDPARATRAPSWVGSRS
jgi:hypothetical protein